MTIFKDSHHFSRTLGDVWWQSLMTVFNDDAFFEGTLRGRFRENRKQTEKHKKYKKQKTNRETQKQQNPQQQQPQQKHQRTKKQTTKPTTTTTTTTAPSRKTLTINLKINMNHEPEVIVCSNSPPTPAAMHVTSNIAIFTKREKGQHCPSKPICLMRLPGQTLHTQPLGL